jgi:toxin ParE1/3/4
MTSPFVDISDDARRDIQSYTLWLSNEADVSVAVRFALSANDSFEQISKAPLIKPKIESRQSTLGNIRKGRVNGFPKMLIFYEPVTGGVRIIRVLHTAQDWWSLLDTE